MFMPISITQQSRPVTKLYVLSKNISPTKSRSSADRAWNETPFSATTMPPSTIAMPAPSS